MPLAMLALLSPWPLAPPQEADHLKAALDAAREREERLKVLTITWKLTTHVPKGGRMDADPAGLPLPRADVTVESTHQLMLNGDHFRVAHNDPGYRKHGLGGEDGIWTFDGERSFSRVYLEGRDKPANLILDRPPSPTGLGGPAVRPIALWCQGTRWEPLSATGRRARTIVPAQIGGDLCIAFRLGAPEGASTTYYLDPRRHHLIRRFRSDASATVEVTDLEYGERPDAGLIPAKWTTIKTRAGGKLVMRVRAEVTDVRVNEPAPAGVFRLDPLPGELVTVNESRRTYRVRAGGDVEELDATGRTEPPVEPARPAAPAWPGRQLVQYIVLPGLLVVLVLIVLRRRGRPAHTPSP